MSAIRYLSLSDGSTTVINEVLPSKSDWTRLQISLTVGTSQTVTARLLTNDVGALYIDCAQIEKAPTASRYNLVQNGDFRDTSYWSGGARTKSTVGIAAPQLDANVRTLTGDPQTTNRISQNVQVSGTAGDTFVVAGWANGYSVPLSTSDSNSR